MEFRNRTTGHIESESPTGSKMAPTYEIEIDKQGHKSLIKTGETNIYEKIQQDLESCKIENILAKAEMGDLSGINAREAQYADITEAPKTLAEAQSSIIRLKNVFAGLTPEQRASFDNSPEKFIAQFGSEEFNKKMGWIKDEELLPFEPPKEELKEETKKTVKESNNND